jgi:flagella synthesis protein FlgN
MRHDIAQGLARHLQRQQVAAQRLLTLLDQERLALAGPKISGERLTELSIAKQAILENLEQLETTRRRAQRSLGHAPDPHGAMQLARDQGCLPAWTHLQDLAGRAQQLNQLNGNSLRVRQQQNQRILNYLTEASSARALRASAAFGSGYKPA